jgi:adenylate cyclase
LRGRAALLRPASRDSYDAASGLFHRALALDPGSVEAQSLLANVLVNRQLDFGSDWPEADIEQAEALSLRALAAAPRNPLAHFAKGQVLRVQGRLDEAISEYETALASDRNWVDALFALGQCKLFAGPIEEAIPLVEQAIRFSPRDPNMGVWCYQIGRVHLLQSRTDEAILWLEKARTANPELYYVHAWLASAYALNGETERAATELATARGLSANDRYTSIARLRAAPASHR